MNAATKRYERAADPRRPVLRMGFDDLMSREALRLHTLRTPEDLRHLADDLTVTLRRAEYKRFVAWIETRYGTAFARRGGLPVGPPRLYLAG
ncbi:MAG: hypothetical protein CVU56_25725 [Deltaproteobacteria bacterium HGW-Deltaproteobacteria-14]|nr:MAG: hypothetical protein CVU56_25725 [Deltaproteobacteria bacterium HGW-Deltaproteobacteria-14]